MSFGFRRMSRNIREAITSALHRNVILLASTGNYGNLQSIQYPAKANRVFKIFATNHNGYMDDISPPMEDPRYTFGALGRAIESIWPTTLCDTPASKGLDITSKTKQNPANGRSGKPSDANDIDLGKWTVMSGTSFSTPIIAALVAIIYQFYDSNKEKVNLNEHSGGLKQIDAVRAILEQMSRTSENHKYNCLEPSRGRGNFFEFEPAKRSGKVVVDRKGRTRVDHFAEKLEEAIEMADV